MAKFCGYCGRQIDGGKCTCEAGRLEYMIYGSEDNKSQTSIFRYFQQSINNISIFSNSLFYKDIFKHYSSVLFKPKQNIKGLLEEEKVQQSSYVLLFYIPVYILTLLCFAIAALFLKETETYYTYPLTTVFIFLLFPLIIMAVTRFYYKNKLTFSEAFSIFTYNSILFIVPMAIHIVLGFVPVLNIIMQAYLIGGLFHSVLLTIISIHKECDNSVEYLKY